MNRHSDDEKPERPATQSPSDEEFILRVVPTSATIVLRVVFWLAVAVLLFKAHSWLFASQNPESPASRPQEVFRFACYTLAAIGFIDIFTAILWRATTKYALTTEHLLIHKGIVFRSGKAISLGGIQGVEYRRSVLGWIGGFGSIELTLKEGEDPLVLDGIPGVSKVFDQIVAQKARVSKGRATTAEPARG